MFHFARARMAGWLLVSLILTLAIAVTAPQQLPVSLYKLSLITSAAWVAYWIDRSLFPYARPDSYLGTADWARTLSLHGKCQSDADLPVIAEYRLVFAATMLRRAIIIAAAMIGVALGA